MLAAALVFALAVLVRTVQMGAALLALGQDYGDLENLASHPEEALRSDQLSAEDGLAGRCESDLTRLREASSPLLQAAVLFSWMPKVGGDLGQAPALVDYAVEVAKLGQIALEGYRASLAGIGQDAQADPGAGNRLVSAAKALGPLAPRLSAQLQKAAAARQAIDQARLSPGVAKWVERSDALLGMAGPALRSLDVLPSILGARGLRRYLLVAQNSDELRATGGYISGVGVIELDGGAVTRVAYYDSYSLEDYGKPHPWPPQPLTSYMGAQQWVIRDANWSPDFPTAAREIETLYELDQGVPVDGVIAVDTDAIQRLVAALGPVQVPGYPVRVDGENVLSLMQSYFFSNADSEPYSAWWSQRKEFMGALFHAIVGDLNGQAPFDAARVGRAFWESLEAKDVLVYLNDAQSESILSELGWDGALRPTTPDAVYVVDSNVGFNKADGKLRRQFDYDVQLQPDGTALASLRLEYDNLNAPSKASCVREIKYGANYAELENACYWDYVRIYVPLGSVPVAATENVSAAVEGPDLGYTVLSGFFVVPRGTSREIRFEYRIPNQPIRMDAPSEYQVEWITQPGAGSVPVNVTVHFPASLRVTRAAPAPASQTDSSIRFSFAPYTDQSISIQFEPENPMPNLPIWALALAPYAAALGVALRRARRSRQTG